MSEGLHANCAVIIKYLCNILYELVVLVHKCFSPFVLEYVSLNFGHCHIYNFVFFGLFIKALDAFSWWVDNRISINKDILSMNFTLSGEILLLPPHAKYDTGDSNTNTTCK